MDEQNTPTEELMQLLVKAKKEKEMLLKEKNELLQEKQTLLGDNKKLKQTGGAEIITQMTVDNEKDVKVPVHALQKVFTVGQIKLLMSSNTRINWSAEDITSQKIYYCFTVHKSKDLSISTERKENATAIYDHLK